LESSVRDGREQIRALIETVFPKGARVVALPGRGEFQLLVSWKLGTDSARPGKRSKTVRILIEQVAMDAYRQAGDSERAYSLNRFRALLARRLELFDPDHDAPMGTEPPIEKWSIGTVELNG
jgi:hypothetical protein